MVTLLLFAGLSVVAGSVLAGIAGLLAQLDWRLGLVGLAVVGLLGVGLVILVLSSGSSSILVAPAIAVGWVLPMTALAVAVWTARRKQQRVDLVKQHICLECGYPIPAGGAHCPECGTAPP